MLERLEQLHRLGAVSEIDLALAKLVARLGGDADEAIALAVCLASSAIAEGDVCADLRRHAGTIPFRSSAPLDLAMELPRAPALDAWRALLRASPAVGAPGDFRPLVLDQRDRLYLHRYWAYEREIADDLRRRAAADPPAVDEDILRDGLERVFGSSSSAAERSASGAAGATPDWQRVAAATAVLRRLCVISGGPGTGKTTTVVRILALLAEQSLLGRRGSATSGTASASGAAGAGPRMLLAAPTGKAAARLQEAARQAKQSLAGRCAAEVLAAIPEDASTIHRLLGPRLESVYFRHDRESPLAADALVIDESSMVDVALMAKVLRALPAHARLVLVGDKDQLASVEAGAVLGDVCGPVSGFSAAFAERVARIARQEIPAEGAPSSVRTGAVPSTSRASAELGAAPLRDAVVLLRHSHRFGDSSGIGALARALREGRGDTAFALLDEDRFAHAGWRSVESPTGLRAALREVVAAAGGHGAYLDLARAGASPGEVFAAFNRFRVLCAVRQGDVGVEAVNEAIAEALDERGLIERRSDWYVGRPVMITRNDYHLRLFNGDVGIALADPDGRLRVHFEEGGDRPRSLPPIRLPQHETVFAMTVHKSQGSEFDRVVLLLPPEGSRILGRELLYTGITRARLRLEVWGRRESFLEAAASPLVRSSGLRDALWGDGYEGDDGAAR